MTVPKEGSPERSMLDQRIDEGIMGAVGDLIGRKTLPPTVHVIYHDKETDERFGAFVDMETRPSGAIVAHSPGIGHLKSGLTMSMVANSLLRRNPGIPLVYSKELADELGSDSLSWIDDDHYRLEGRPEGTLEVFIPFSTAIIPTDHIVPGTRFRLFTE